MEDLIGLIAIIIFAVVNMLAQGAKKKRMQESKPAAEGEEVPKKGPSSIEEFFERLAEKIEPKEPDLPKWPDGYEKPDYAGEMNTFETPRTEPPPPPPVPEPMMMEAKHDKIPSSVHKISLKSTMKSVPSAFSSASGMRILSTPMFRSQTGPGKENRVSLKNKSELKKAIIANVIFSPPRAYDTSFDNSII